VLEQCISMGNARPGGGCTGVYPQPRENGGRSAHPCAYEWNGRRDRWRPWRRFVEGMEGGKKE
jgi:hypothetical protein